MIKKDKKLTKYIHRIEEKHIDLLNETCNTSCWTGCDLEGSTGLEIFEAGHDLGRSCEVVFVVFSSKVPFAWFFEADYELGEDQNADSVIAWLKDAVAERK